MRMPQPDAGQATGTGASRWRRRRAEPAELRAQLKQMRTAVEPFVTDGGRRAYWTARWEAYVLLAARRVISNREQFYQLRLLAVSSSVIVPSLVGLNLSGTGGVWAAIASYVRAHETEVIAALTRPKDDETGK
jgi:hypothetical protein